MQHGCFDIVLSMLQLDEHCSRESETVHRVRWPDHKLQL